MPRFNRVKVSENKYATKYLGGYNFVSTNGHTNNSVLLESDPVILDCEPGYLDCNWFLSVGCRAVNIPQCQIGTLDLQIYNTANPIRVQFTGSVTYQCRPGLTTRSTVQMKTVAAIAVATSATIGGQSLAIGAYYSEIIG